MHCKQNGNPAWQYRLRRKAVASCSEDTGRYRVRFPVNRTQICGANFHSESGALGVTVSQYWRLICGL